MFVQELRSISDREVDPFWEAAMGIMAKIKDGERIVTSCGVLLQESKTSPHKKW
jgi:hypothetical protein